MDPARPSADTRLDALVARATLVAVERHATSQPRRSRPILIGLAVLGLGAVIGSFVVATRSPADSGAAATPTATTSVVRSAPVTAATATPIASVPPRSAAVSSAATTLVALPTVGSAPGAVVTAPPAALAPAPTPATSRPAPATELLTGPPLMRLPGGQDWPNGLYQDNIMYLRGTVPSEEIGGDLQRRAEDILGTENVRNELVIDPTVPKVETVIVRLGNSVLFKSGDFDIPPESEPGFLLWAAFLAANPSVSLTVIGHADSRGTPESNRQLALQRAQVAAERVTRNGIDPSRVTAVSRGADDPIAVNDTQEGRSLNRRVEFAVTGLLSA